MPLSRGWVLTVDYGHALSRREKKAHGVPQRARAARPWAVFTLKTDVPSIVATVYETAPGVWRADFSNAAKWNLTRSTSMAARVMAERVCRALVAEHHAFWSSHQTGGVA